MLMTKTILGNLLHKYATRLHPMEERALPAGARGDLRLDADKCIACRMCANKCPSKVLRVDPEAGMWEHKTMGCLYCGVCADVCPTDCITMTNRYRRPITEPAVTRYTVKARPKKSKEGAAAPAAGGKAAGAAASAGAKAPVAEKAPAGGARGK
jgi:ech hydrogenase subunit F